MLLRSPIGLPGLFVLFVLLSASTLVSQEADRPLPAGEAAQTMQVPPDFQVELFAGEPAVQQPIGFCIDDRNRLWGAEAYAYPVHGTGKSDRIVILEDSDGDGRHDRRTLFYEGLNYVTGIEVGFGGVWVMSPPSMLFIPDRNADDIPDGPPQVILDGFGNHANAHNLANGFAWGPDGWLYGTHGRTNWSMIGRPGTAEADRQRFDGGVYRYHPVQHRWEAYADGTTNPWGIDWNDLGHAFICNCVNPHLFQVIQGAHYEPWRGRKSSQHAYQRIDTIADHLHYVGISDVRRGIGSADEDAAGGGHAHCGTIIYLGDALPAPYRNTLMTNNLHGRRINNDIPRRSGSGYIASHGPDLMRSQDPWFMGVTLAYGAAGEIYVSDWSDTGECHSVRNTQRQTGRIFRITYKQETIPRVDLARYSDDQLVEAQLHDNDWHVRHARRRLQERAASGADMRKVHRELHQMFLSQTAAPKRLRALWALHVTDGASDEWLTELLDDPEEAIRSWAITLLCEDHQPPTAALAAMLELAASGDSPLVRLSITSALQRMPLAKRWELVEALARRSEDASDQNLPLMLWYATEPLIDDDLARYVRLATKAEIPRLRINIARRIASSSLAEPGVPLLIDRISEKLIDAAVAANVLDGLLEGMRGRKLALPANWPDAYASFQTSDSGDVRSLATRVALALNDPGAIALLRRVAIDRQAAAVDRNQAIEALVARGAAGLDTDLLSLLDDPTVRRAAIRGLARYANETTAARLIAAYPKWEPIEQQDVLQTLASRATWASDLMAAIDDKQISARDLTAFTARQLRSLNNNQVSADLDRLWGKARPAGEDRQKQIASYKKWLTAELIATADTTRGRELFTKNCATCHKFFGSGGDIGPDITGAQRSNLDYLLENIVDPSAAVAKDYRMQVLQLIDGRVITGLVESSDDQSITIRTVNDRSTILRDDIDLQTESPVSIMPSGLLDPMTEADVRDLIGYLQQRHAVP
ncbi:Cytochrome c [Rosistilla ulvae]|uniref:Cytochrome c n=1 Tax=Rosistilla ulvae TaxID=1930277 RepID=A0A517LYG7_9BACT|nr:PVC-type heme-binding CxxCH protein [Rosistilla ulvae]QDS87675.1 Cytochrome c [Rosistilla ulvae]